MNDLILLCRYTTTTCCEDCNFFEKPVAPIRLLNACPNCGGNLERKVGRYLVRKETRLFRADHIFYVEFILKEVSAGSLKSITDMGDLFLHALMESSRKVGYYKAIGESLVEVWKEEKEALVAASSYMEKVISSKKGKRLFYGMEDND